jgi:heptosyltransferase-2
MYKNILLFHIAGLGDFVESIRILKSLRDEYPDSKIVLVCSDKIIEYVKFCPYIDLTISWPVHKDKAFVWFKFFNYLKIILKLKKYKFDLMINFNEVSNKKSAFMLKQLIRLISPKVTVGRNTNGLGKFFDKFIEDNDQLKINQTKYYEKLVKLVGVTKIVSYPEFWFSNRQKINISFAEEKEIVGIGIGANRESRLWKKEYFVEIINYLKKDYNIILLGDKNVKLIAEEIVNEVKGTNILNYVARTSIEELIKIISQCKLVISINSSIAHIAANLQIFLIDLIGPGNFFRDKPNGEDSKIHLLYKDVGCNPCYYFRCPLKKDKMKCMYSITPDLVIEKIRLFIYKKW